jgi:hypothetical protein
MMRWLIILALSIPMYSQQVLPIVGSTGTTPVVSIMLIDHQTCQNSATCSPSSLNITGASLIICAVAAYNNIVPCTDTGLSSWQSATLYGGSAGANVYVQIFYVYNPSGTSDTITCAGQYFSCMISSWSGTLGTSGVLDTQNGSASSGSQTSCPISPGSITPGATNELLIVLAGNLAGSTFTTIDSGFTVLDSLGYIGGTSEPGGVAYLVDSSVSSINPSWTTAGGGALGCSATIAAFKHS